MGTLKIRDSSTMCDINKLTLVIVIDTFWMAS